MLFLIQSTDPHKPALYVSSGSPDSAKLPDDVSYTFHPVSGPLDLTVLARCAEEAGCCFADLESAQKKGYLNFARNLAFAAGRLIRTWKQMPPDGVVRQKSKMSEVIVWTITADDDNGTRTYVYGSEEDAENRFRDLIEAAWHIDYGDMPTDLHDANDALKDKIGFIDTYIMDQQLISVKPT